MGWTGATDAVSRLREALPKGGQLPDDVFERRHRALTTLLWIHAAVLPMIGVLQGQTLSHSLLEASFVAGLALAASVRGASQVLRSTLTTAGLMASSAVLVHFFNGLIELHFHFFVMIAAISLYQRWTPYLVGVGFVAFHHGIVGTIAPEVVYNHPLAIAHPFWFAIVHGGFLLAESVACLAYWRTSEQTLAAERHERATAESANAALARAHGELSDLMGMLSHDLRTPLAVVNGFSVILKEDWEQLPSERRDELLVKVVTAGKTLQTMLDDTLSLAALDADGLHPEPQPVYLNQAVRDTLDLLADPLVNPSVSEVDSAVAMVDPGHLQQILSNLITNAGKYGAPPYRFVVRRVGERATVAIEDSGAGVPQEFAVRLFERFARADTHRAGSVKGTGLGLYIAQRLAIANGGELRYRRLSREGGSAFTLDLPAAVGHAVPPTQAGVQVVPQSR